MVKVIKTYPDKKGLVRSASYYLAHQVVKSEKYLKELRINLCCQYTMNNILPNVEDISNLMEGKCTWHRLRFDTGWEGSISYIYKLLGFTCVIWSRLFLPTCVMIRNYCFQNSFMVRDYYFPMNCNQGLLFPTDVSKIICLPS